MERGEHVHHGQPRHTLMLELKPLRLKDFLPLVHALSLDERGVILAMTGEAFDADQIAAATVLSPGMHWVFEAPERPVCAGGFVRQRPGVYRTWFVAPDSAWYTHGAEITRLVRDVIRNTLVEEGVHRIETVTLADRHRARAWYEKIGLTYESTMPKFGANGEDAVMYVAVRGEG